MSPQLHAVVHLVHTRYLKLFSETPSPLKLHQLCYYAQGYLLAQGVELFPEDFEAWQLGPIIPELFRQTTNRVGRPDFGVPPQNAILLSEDVVKEVSDIVEAYGQYGEGALSDMVRRDNPWIDVRSELSGADNKVGTISKQALRTYFAYKLA